jgi:chromosome partitioning protein
MAKIAECIAFSNPKGGSGKTTSCLSVAGYLAKSGGKVLVVDLDPQASATSGLGIDSKSLHRSIYDAMLAHCDGHNGVTITQVILETEIDNLHLAPSEPDLSVAEILLRNVKNRQSILKLILADVSTLYDYILVDLPPSYGLLMLNGLCAADQVVVPLDSSIYSLEALANLKTSFNDIKRISGHSFKQITAILIRYVKPDIFARLTHRLGPSQEVEVKLKQMFGSVFIVPDSNLVFETQKKGIPISHYAPASQLGIAYRKIAENLNRNTETKSILRSK